VQHRHPNDDTTRLSPTAQQRRRHVTSARARATVAILAVLTLTAATVAPATAKPTNHDNRTTQDRTGLCHLTDDEYKLLELTEAAAQAHRRHGDAAPHDPVPDMDGSVFDETCTPVAASSCFTGDRYSARSTAPAGSIGDVELFANTSCSGSPFTGPEPGVVLLNHTTGADLRAACLADWYTRETRWYAPNIGICLQPYSQSTAT
jgi:hypothetical protein